MSNAIMIGTDVLRVNIILTRTFDGLWKGHIEQLPQLTRVFNSEENCRVALTEMFGEWLQKRLRPGIQQNIHYTTIYK